MYHKNINRHTTLLHKTNTDENDIAMIESNKKNPRLGCRRRAVYIASFVAISFHYCVTVEAFVLVPAIPSSSSSSSSSIPINYQQQALRPRDLTGSRLTGRPAVLRTTAGMGMMRNIPMPQSKFRHILSALPVAGTTVDEQKEEMMTVSTENILPYPGGEQGLHHKNEFEKEYRDNDTINGNRNVNVSVNSGNLDSSFFLEIPTNSRSRVDVDCDDYNNNADQQQQQLQLLDDIDSRSPLSSAIDDSKKDKDKQSIKENDYNSEMSITISGSNNNNHGIVQFVGLGSWIVALSTFLLVNNYVGPFPAKILASTPVKAFGFTHAISGMLFGGGVILTTLLEWLAVGSKSKEVIEFYFDKVPKLDSFVVLPALTMSILSGVGLAVDHYGSLGESPFHVVGAISALLLFAIWWAVTDVTTQGASQTAISEWIQTNDQQGKIPRIVEQRKISNVISCVFVLVIYGFMVLKPGFNP